MIFHTMPAPTGPPGCHPSFTRVSPEFHPPSFTPEFHPPRGAKTVIFMFFVIFHDFACSNGPSRVSPEFHPSFTRVSPPTWSGVKLVIESQTFTFHPSFTRVSPHPSFTRVSPPTPGGENSDFSCFCDFSCFFLLQRALPSFTRVSPEFHPSSTRFSPEFRPSCLQVVVFFVCLCVCAPLS